MKRLRLAILAASFLVAAPAAAAGPQVEERAWTQKGTSLFISPQPQSGLVFVGVVVKTGASSVPADKEGLAYFTAKMLQRGTQTRSREQLADALDFLGADLNVSVRQGSMWLTGEVLARNLDAYLELLADVVLNPAFPDAEVERLRGEILGELEIQRESDQGLGNRYFRRAYYQGPYGQFAKGTPKGVTAIKTADLRAHYDKHFVGSNLLFVASGDIGAGRFESQIRRAFAGLKKGTAPARPPLEVPKADGIRVVLIDKPDRTQNQIFIGHRAVKRTDPDYYPYSVANNAFGGMFTARLMKEVRVKRGWSYGAYSRLLPDFGDGVFFMWTFPANDDTMPTIQLVLQLYREFQARGITSEEVKSARSNLANRFAFRMETPEKQLREHVVATAILGLPDSYLAKYQDSVSAVTLDQANAAAKKHSTPGDLVIVMVCTADKFAKDIAKLPGVERVEVIPFDAEDPDTARKTLSRK